MAESEFRVIFFVHSRGCTSIEKWMEALPPKPPKVRRNQIEK